MNHSELTTSISLPDLGEMLGARWYVSQDLVALDNSILRAFESAYPAAEVAANIGMEQRHATLANFKGLLLERDQFVQKLLVPGCMPLPASVIPWCQLSGHLAKMPIQAWGFVYMDAATNQPIGLQTVLAKNMPKLFAAASNTLLQDGWCALEWVDIMPHAAEAKEYENALLAAMQRRRHFLANQMIFLDVQIAAQQIKVNQIPSV